MTVAERYVPDAAALGAAAGRADGCAAAPRRRRSRDGRIVLAGGEEDAGTITRGRALRPARRARWSGLPDMPIPRHGLGVVAQGRRVFTVQGGPEPGFHFSNAIESLTVE